MEGLEGLEVWESPPNKKKEASLVVRSGRGSYPQGAQAMPSSLGRLQRSGTPVGGGAETYTE